MNISSKTYDCTLVVSMSNKRQLKRFWMYYIMHLSTIFMEVVANCCKKFSLIILDCFIFFLYIVWWEQ